MKKQTAFQYYIEQHIIASSRDNLSLEEKFKLFDEIIEKTKQMEKEQIVNAWIDDRFPLDKDWVKQRAEQYYNETYGGNKYK